MASAAVTVCGTMSLLVHTMVSPAATSTRSGTNFMPSMRTACVFPAACAAAAPKRSAAASTARRATFIALLAQRGLQVLGVLEVRRDRRADLLDQPLQLGVLRVRDEHLVDRVEDLLVVVDFVIDIGLVELGALQRLQLGFVVLRRALQGLAGVALGGLHVQLLGEGGRLLVHRSVVGDHLLRELLDFLVLAVRLRDLAG